jgi:hypothetical protein
MTRRAIIRDIEALSPEIRALLPPKSYGYGELLSEGQYGVSFKHGKTKVFTKTNREKISDGYDCVEAANITGVFLKKYFKDVYTCTGPDRLQLWKGHYWNGVGNNGTKVNVDAVVINPLTNARHVEVESSPCGELELKNVMYIDGGMLPSRLEMIDGRWYLSRIGIEAFSVAPKTVQKLAINRDTIRLSERNSHISYQAATEIYFGPFMDYQIESWQPLRELEEADIAATKVVRKLYRWRVQDRIVVPENGSVLVDAFRRHENEIVNDVVRRLQRITVMT